jgi:hypothetical protein
MKRLLQPSEWVNEPRPHDAVHDDEIASSGISFIECDLIRQLQDTARVLGSLGNAGGRARCGRGF